MKLYNKPELCVEKFDVEDVITLSGEIDSGNEGGDVELNAGMEFSVAANNNDEF